jgi:hypothetical protein
MKKIFLSLLGILIAYIIFLGIKITGVFKYIEAIGENEF